MISRYTLKEMGQKFSERSRFDWMLRVEICVAEVQAQLGLIPKAAAVNIKEKAQFEVERILEIEKTTKHDVIAFVSACAENVGEDGRWIHYGMTSSDVLDTALALQLLDAGELLLSSIEKVILAFKVLAEKEARTLCAGRTHGMHAEPTSFGFKMAGHWQEWLRVQKRMQFALSELRFGKLSGAVGTNSTQSPEVEKRVCEMLGLQVEPVATQVIPRDRHAHFFSQLALMAGAIERIAVELRHLQRTELGEVIEAFTPGQKGSSAMPHKKNPISAENLTGLARLIRSYSMAALENMALWHERDISHSSVERVIVPDALIVAHYACERLQQLLNGLYVDRQAMLRNLNLSRGQSYSSHLLLALVESGLSREAAYKLVQSLSHSISSDGTETLESLALKSEEVTARVSAKTIAEIFTGKIHQTAILRNLEKLGLNIKEAK